VIWGGDSPFPVAVCGNELPYVAACSNVLQCVPSELHQLQCVASVLQYEGRTSPSPPGIVPVEQ